MEPRLGDFLLTCNAPGTNDEGNPSPGHWNHVSVAVEDAQYTIRLIEAQAEPYNRVIRSSWYEFYNRYPEIIILRPPAEHASKIAQRAESLFGHPYRAMVLRFKKREKLGENCVTVARKAWTYATGFDLKWRIPDHLLGSVPHYLTVVGKKEA